MADNAMALLSYCEPHCQHIQNLVSRDNFQLAKVTLGKLADNNDANQRYGHCTLLMTPSNSSYCHLYQLYCITGGSYYADPNTMMLQCLAVYAYVYLQLFPE